MSDANYRASRYQRFLARHMATNTLPMTMEAINYRKPDPIGVPVSLEQFTARIGVRDAKID